MLEELRDETTRDMSDRVKMLDDMIKEMKKKMASQPVAKPATGPTTGPTTRPPAAAPAASSSPAPAAASSPPKKGFFRVVRSLSEQVSTIVSCSKNPPPFPPIAEADARMYAFPGNQ